MHYNVRGIKQKIKPLMNDDFGMETIIRIKCVHNYSVIYNTVVHNDNDVKTYISETNNHIDEESHY